MNTSNLVFEKNGIKKNVLISFVIPTYKNRAFLKSAIDSILNQCNRNFNDYEIIVISNNVGDDLSDVWCTIKECNCRIRFYVNSQNLGQVGNINRGARLAAGKYIAYLHDDDLLLNNYFTEVLPIIKRKDIHVLVPSMYTMEQNYKYDLKHRFASCIFAVRFLYRKKIQELKYEECLRSFYDIYSAPTCGALFSKKLLLDEELFRESRGAAWDYYNYRIINKKYPIYLLHRYVGVRRTETGMSNEVRIQKEFFEDRILLAQEERNNKFIAKYYDVICGKTSKKAFLFWLLTRTFFYLHNLDSRIGITKKLYLQINKGEK